MTTFPGPRWAAALALCWCFGAAEAAATLKPYRDEAEFTAALQRWRAEAQRVTGEQQRRQGVGAMTMDAAPSPAPTSAPSAALQESASRSRADADSITNVQTAGVDEGGIVKRAGEHLVVLRRGRLFTVRVGGDQLQPVSRIDAFAPGADPRGAWYDELLISGSQVVVIGYSYARGGTEIGLFELADNGALSYRATHHLRSFDYYSSRNYASRLVGRRLIFYTPTLLQAWDSTPLPQLLPAARRWQATVPAEFERILPATRIYRTDDDFSPAEPLALHTVTGCELGHAALRCESTAVLGPAGRVFYVSAGSVYVWTTNSRRRMPVLYEDRPNAERSLSAVFRLPLDGSAPTGLKTAGVPVDQMSFLEDGQGQLNVLLREHGGGEGMWGAERGRGALALLRVPLADFADGRSAARREQYRRLPSHSLGPAAWPLQNRYIGDWLLWGGGEGAWALRYAQASAQATALEPDHGVERIEALGEHALLVGNRGADLHFSAVRLARSEPRIESQHVQASARQGETRTHGFYYHATGHDEGVLGLPVIGTESPRRGGAAAVVLLRLRSGAFAALGALSASAGPVDDGCRASCADWYGNARPIFLGERVLALMGYEIVEGRLQGRGAGESVQELRRISFAPGAGRREGRPSPFE